MSAPLSSVQNALTILHLLRRQGALRVSDIATELGIGVSTAHRLLSTLRSERFVRQEADGKRYELGPAMLFAAGTSAIEHCVSVAGSVMQDLRDTTDETVHLGLIRGSETVFLASAESRRMVRVSSRLGHHPQAHTTAVGKVLLAELCAEAIVELYPDEGLETLTPQTLATRDDLINELERVRREGYARNIRESEDDMYTIAVPLRRPDGTAVCALALSAPSERAGVPGQRALTSVEEGYRESLMNARAVIEGRLGF